MMESLRLSVLLAVFALMQQSCDSLLLGRRVQLWPPEGSFLSASMPALQSLVTASSTSTVTNTMKDFSPSQERLPWKSSLVSSRDLTYMSFFSHQLSVMSRLGLTEVSLQPSTACEHSKVKTARIGNMQFEGGKFRKVRLTYFDAGDNVQVFNALWYPQYEYDMPLLGIDLISLGKSRVLNVIDFQPLSTSPEYSAKYINPLTGIRKQYPDLHGQLSGKFNYDTSSFSSNMLFGRFTDESKVKSVLFPAFKEYTDAYVQMAEKCEPDYSFEGMEKVKARQQQYDIHSAEKDPAVGLFEAYFGKEWSSDFVHDFLFEHSTAPSIENHTSQVVHNFKVDQQTGQVEFASQRPSNQQQQQHHA